QARGQALDPSEVSSIGGTAPTLHRDQSHESAKAIALRTGWRRIRGKKWRSNKRTSAMGPRVIPEPFEFLKTPKPLSRFTLTLQKYSSFRWLQSCILSMNKDDIWTSAAKNAHLSLAFKPKKGKLHVNRA